MTAIVLAVSTLSGGSVAVADEELTKQQFIEAADALCKKTDEFLSYVTIDISSKGMDPTAPPTDAQLEDFSKYFAYAYRELITDIRRLEEPAADRATVKKLLKALSKEVAQIEDDPLVLRAGPIMPKSTKLAKRYGFQECGSTS